MNETERRSARLLFARELAAGRIGERELDRARVARAVADAGPPPRPLGAAARVADKLGWLGYERHVVRPFARAREAVLGGAAAGEPRLLVRVDEFPHYRSHAGGRYGPDAYERFHAAMVEAGVSYLVAVSPRVSHDPLDPADTHSRPLDDRELELLERLKHDGVAFAMHGRTHSTRDARPRRHSELSGLSAQALDELLDEGLAELVAAGIAPRVFVPPYNRFDARQYDQLAARFDIVCGGPENVTLLGYRRTPLWRGDAVYLPSYLPFYGPAISLAPALARVARRGAAIWIPVALHWGWEYDNGWHSLERLARWLAPYSRSWSEFQAEVEASSLDV